MITVLLVDDDTLMGASLERYFSLLSEFRFVYAENYSDAVRISRKIHLDVALLDIVMPEHDGFEVCKALREQDPELPVIFITGHFNDEMMLRAMQVSCNGFIQKPYQPRWLEQQLKQMIKARKKTKLSLS
jgi:DNA-binding NtrC family response regulator